MFVSCPISVFKRPYVKITTLFRLVVMVHNPPSLSPCRLYSCKTVVACLFCSACFSSLFFLTLGHLKTRRAVPSYLSPFFFTSSSFFFYHPHLLPPSASFFRTQRINKQEIYSPLVTIPLPHHHSPTPSSRVLVSLSPFPFPIPPFLAFSCRLPIPSNLIIWYLYIASSPFKSIISFPLFLGILTIASAIVPSDPHTLLFSSPLIRPNLPPTLFIRFYPLLFIYILYSPQFFQSIYLTLSIPLSIYPLLSVHPSLTTVCHRLDLASNASSLWTDISLQFIGLHWSIEHFFYILYFLFIIVTFFPFLFLSSHS